MKYSINELEIDIHINCCNFSGFNLFFLAELVKLDTEIFFSEEANDTDIPFYYMQCKVMIFK